MRPYLILINLLLSARSLLAVEFTADWIYWLPPSVAEWHSREGMAFCEAAERAGMSWAEAHWHFTGQHLRAIQTSLGSFIYFTGNKREGRIDLIKIDDHEIQLRILTDPEDGSFQSSKVHKIKTSQVLKHRTKIPLPSSSVFCYNCHCHGDR